MQKQLYLLNDNVNSFEDVIFQLKKYLSYPTLQGHSIASIVHQNGECCIYTGHAETVDKLEAIFINNGFNAEAREGPTTSSSLLSRLDAFIECGTNGGKYLRVPGVGFMIPR